MKKQLFNDQWIFYQGGGCSLAKLLGTEKTEKAVTLPHDASIEQERDAQDEEGSGNGYFCEETIHYTKEFTLDQDVKDKKVFIEFEGVYQNAFVYINNSFAGKCPYGYSNFYIDATNLIKPGNNNLIKVVVKNGVASGRWYTGNGIYRDVNILVGDRLYLTPDKVHIAARDVDTECAGIQVNSEISYEGIGVRDVVLKTAIINKEGKIAAEDQIPLTIPEGTKQTYRQTLYVQNPALWGVDTPNLYEYKVSICENDRVIDEETGKFGIRKLQLDTCYGLRINGEVVKLKGGCIHHDNGIIGSAEFAHAEEYRVRKLKEAGYNAIRSAHYPMSRKLLDACDKYGMLVMDEYSDVWTSSKVDYDYGTNMTEWWEHDICHMVDKDYNHPCVIMYSIGNEIPETGNKHDTQWGKKFADLFRKLDDTRYVTNCLNLVLSIMDRLDEVSEINSMMSDLGEMMTELVKCDLAGSATAEALGQVDIAGYNYAAARYEKDQIKYPNRIIVGSETFPKDLDINWELVEKYPRIIGDFSWTAWDYLGEAGIGSISYGEEKHGFYAPYPCKAAYCGDFNLIGDRRPVSYWREIIWGGRTAPYIAVQPPKYYGVKHNMADWGMTNAVRSWNFRRYEGKPVVVEVYANAEEASLLLNGKEIAHKPLGEEKKNMALFETVYDAGVLETVVYQAGREVGRDRLVTAGDVSKISAAADRAEIPADGSDICYVEISLVDKQGLLNTEALNAVSISVTGSGVLQGYGSADHESEENYFDTCARAFEGRLKAAIRGNGTKGTIHIKIQTENVDPVDLTIEAV